MPDRQSGEGHGQRDNRQTRIAILGGRLNIKQGRGNDRDDDDRDKDPKRIALRKIYHETKSLLPGILATRPDVGIEGYSFVNVDKTPLDPSKCPNLPSVTVSVQNADTIDAAIKLGSHVPWPPVCVLNMANARSAGGGWANGSLAQEESLCYRSSLSFTLKLGYYPIPEQGGIFSSKVLIIRHGIRTPEKWDDGHNNLTLANPTRADELHVISAVSVAAIDSPAIIFYKAKRRNEYAKQSDRLLMKSKMRNILRIAAMNGRRRLVLGAFGCGAFHNPRTEVAKMWGEVLKEHEFKGWFEAIVFAVIDSGAGSNGTFGIFTEELNGLKIEV